MFNKRLWVLMLFPLLCLICEKNQAYSEGKEWKKIVIKITSTAFKNGKMIPQKYTCDGKNFSPPLSWTSLPDGTKSIALIVDDPDAPGGTWVHWVVYDLPPDINELSEDVPPQNKLENGAKQGTNDFEEIGYGGPCPPSGTHRYYFKIYALDNETGLKAGATKAELLSAMKGHILAKAQLMGKYKKKK